MTHGSLFSGIGGFDLAAEWMGWENKFHCEWNEFGQRVLHHYWPDAELFTDITKSDFTKYANQIDVLTGGFPCQPYSAAGKRLGKEDERHLWPQMCRAIREVAPRYVVGENVRGLTNWNGGLVFNEVCADLENIGYQVAPFIIPASAVNAPHQRERVWFVAYAEAVGFTQSKRTDERGKHQQNNGNEIRFAIDTDGSSNDATNANGNGFNQCDCEHEKLASETGFDALNDINQDAMHTDSTSKQGKYIGQKREGKFDRSNCRNGINQFKNFPTQSPICGGDDGLPSELDGITFSKWRNESIKAYGNAIVPQVVYQIFKSIEAYERTLHINHLGGHALCNPGMDGETDTRLDVVTL
jgi:DNA (cytosine-5)-methyltransferase 1